jgi:hypothetical protein
VVVNGTQWPNVNDTGGAGGWYYNADANSIVFQGSTYTPPQGAAINVMFDPQELTF